MCGIVGVIGGGLQDGAASVQRMLVAQGHRGPDGTGEWHATVGSVSVAFGHGRLAIIDLSADGMQPFHVADDVLTFNGEIYNYVELRAELETRGVVFRTRTDTEVLLAALRHYGLDDALARLNGMWAFAWLDRARQRVVLCRDRFGVKPLYIHRTASGALVFASEIKSVLAAVDRRFTINPGVAARFLEQNALDASTDSFFTGVESIPAGHSVAIDLHAGAEPLPPRRFWSIPTETTLPEKLDAQIEALGALFTDAVRVRLRSDVPVGVLLSGGLDSSAIAATMRDVLGPGADLHLISAVSDDARFSEEPHVDRMARHLNVAAKKVRLPSDARALYRLLDTVTWHNDEPVTSFSAAAHYTLMEEAKQQGVTVILSGQGADEQLCGYRKYLGFRVQELLRGGRLLAAGATLGGFVARGTVLSEFDLADARRYLPSAVRDSGTVLGRVALGAYAPLALGLGKGSLVARQTRDVEELSVPALVHYEDRMSMAWGREIRLPFLDYRIVSALVALDPARKLRSGWTKWIFRRAMESRLPTEITWRRDKKGFSLPQATWLARDLRAEVDAVLSGDMITADAGIVDRQALRTRVEAFRRQPDGIGRIGFREVFNPIALEVWARRFAASLQV